MVNNIAGYALSIVGAIYIGRLGALQLSASVLANSLYNCTGLSLALGLSAGMETLCGQVRPHTLDSLMLAFLLYHHSQHSRGRAWTCVYLQGSCKHTSTLPLAQATLGHVLRVLQSGWLYLSQPVCKCAPLRLYHSTSQQ
jgi:hypothetical protein